MVFNISESISSIAGKLVDTRTVQTNKASILKLTESYRPVYRIVITYPTTDDDYYSRVIIDTSNRELAATGLPVSNVIGMWIDNDDVGQPDKAVVIFKVNEQYTVDHARGKHYDTISDEDLSFHRYFSTRNWIDIWIGYQDIITGKAIPDNLHWYGESHVFSGAIAMVRKKFSMGGEQLTIVALSGEIILRQANFRSNVSPQTFVIEDTKNKEKIGLNVALTQIFEKLMSESQYESLKTVAIENGTELQAFVVGDFYWFLIKQGIENILDLLKNPTNVEINRKKYYHNIDNWLSNAMFDGTLELQSTFTISGQINFWELINTFLNKSHVSGVYNTGFRLLRMGNFDSNEEKVAFRASKISTVKKIFSKRRILKEDYTEAYHAGVHFQFFLSMDTDEIVEVNKGGVYTNDTMRVVPDRDLQSVTLGQDVIDLETYIDYDSVYNSFAVMTKSTLIKPDFSISDPKYRKLAGIKYVPEDLDFKVYNVKINNASNPEEANKVRESKKFWNLLKKDIKIYGEKRYPVPKNFSKPIDQLEKEKHKTQIMVKSAKDLLDKNESLTEIAGYTGIASMFKRYYNIGLQGTTFVIGNPSLKTGRLIQIRDIRSSDSSVWKDFDVAGTIANVVRISPMKTNSGIINLTQKFVEYQNRHGEPMGINTNFNTAINHYFYIWKTRHYYGATSGYLTKVYFMKKRQYVWKAGDMDSIAGILQKALRISEEQFGG